MPKNRCEAVVSAANTFHFLQPFDQNVNKRFKVGSGNSKMRSVGFHLLTKDRYLPIWHAAFMDSKVSPWMILENPLIALESIHLIPIFRFALLETLLPLMHTEKKLTASRLREFLPDYLQFEKGAVTKKRFQR